MTFAVAAQAASAGFLPRLPFEDEYFGFVAATCHVASAGTMAPLATLLRGAAFLIQCGLPVRRLLPCVVNLLVTGLAGFRSDVLGGFRGRHTSRGCAGRLRPLTGSLRGSVNW